MKGGAKQGCHMSGSVFVLCIDPFVRRLLVRSLVDLIQLTAYVDDIAVVFANALQDLLAVVLDLDRWAAASALTVRSCSALVFLRRGGGSWPPARPRVQGRPPPIDMYCFAVAISRPAISRPTTPPGAPSRTRAAPASTRAPAWRPTSQCGGAGPGDGGGGPRLWDLAVVSGVGGSRSQMGRAGYLGPG